MKGQDLAILIKMVANEERQFSVNELAHELAISQGEISKALKRLQESGLMESSNRKPIKSALFGILLHGVKYFFPASPGKMVRGIATSHSAPPLNKKILSKANYVWPDPNGDIRGEEIIPLYKGISKAVKIDRNFYELMALIDAVRVGAAREAKLAINELRKRILHE